jgi:hypothetical protein
MSALLLRLYGHKILSESIFPLMVVKKIFGPNEKVKRKGCLREKSECSSNTQAETALYD